MTGNAALAVTVIGWAIVFASLFVTHFYSQKRQAQDRRDKLRLDLYLNLLESTLAHRKNFSELNQREFVDEYHGFMCRLLLLGSKAVMAAYNAYFNAAIQQIESIQPSERDANDLLQEIDAILDAMADDFQMKSRPMAERIRQLVGTKKPG